MTDLIERMDAIVACQVGPSDEWSKATKSGYAQAATDCARNILAIPSVTHAQVRAKPLVWDELDQDRGDGTTDLTGNHEAVSVVGVYETELGFGSDSYYWSVARDGVEIGHSFEDLIYAKAAAQADYEARILSALIDQPAPDLKRREAMLTKALNVAMKMLTPYQPGDSRAVDDWFVACAAVQCELDDADGKIDACLDAAILMPDQPAPDPVAEAAGVLRDARHEAAQTESQWTAREALLIDLDPTALRALAGGSRE